MRTEMFLWRLAIGCALLLVIAPFTPRTSWINPDNGGARHSAGWDWVAPLSAVAAITGLVIGRSRRPRVAGAVFGALVASFFLAVAAAAALGHWLDLMSGSLDYERWVIYPAPAVGYFAMIGTAGMMASLVLLGTWLKPGETEG